MKSSVPRLSVLVITYNHEAFVAKAIGSVLMQEISEPFEIVIADDCSTDKTREIIRRLSKERSDIHFRFLDSDSNFGITKNYQRAFEAIRSEFVAVIEGDDYWVDTHKLQMQIDFLKRHRECGLCAVNYYVYEEDACRFTPRAPIDDGFTVFGARELIADNIVGNFSTCMYRTQVLRELPMDIFKIRSYDWAINICVAKYHMIGFLRRPMSVYRIHAGGSWSLLSRPEKVRAQLQLIPEYDRVTGGVFCPEFSELTARLSVHLADLERPVPLIEHSTNHIFSELPSSETSRISKYLDFSPPFVVCLARQLLPPAFKRCIGRWFSR